MMGNFEVDTAVVDSVSVLHYDEISASKRYSFDGV